MERLCDFFIRSSDCQLSQDLQLPVTQRQVDPGCAHLLHKASRCSRRKVRLSLSCPTDCLNQHVDMGVLQHVADRTGADCANNTDVSVAYASEDNHLHIGQLCTDEVIVGT